MITVNLRPGQKRKRGGSPLASIQERLKVVGARVKDPLLVAAVVAWVAVVGFLGFTWATTKSDLAALEPQLEDARTEHKRFATFIGEKRRQELIRDSLVSQIGTIRGVDGDRYIWPHLLDEVARALPAYTWLTDMGMEGTTATVADSASDSTAAPLVFRVTGRTVDIQAYTRFLRQLEASPWIFDVTPVSALTVVENERAVTAFTIRASFRRADSAYIRTVPLNQSVR